MVGLEFREQLSHINAAQPAWYRPESEKSEQRGTFQTPAEKYRSAQRKGLDKRPPDGWHLLPCPASDGTQGLALTAANPPVAIVLDLLMPGMTGFEVVQRLRKDDRTASIPVLGCSAKELSLADRRRLTSQVTATCGAADVSDLIGTIRHLLERRRKAER